MQKAARTWRRAFRRLVCLAERAGDPVVCELPRWTDDEIERHFAYIEMRAGMSLPPSYSDFLRECDGCRNLFRGARLLSLGQLLDPMQEAAADAVLEDLNTPIPSFVSPVKPQWRDENLMCIGMNPEGDIVFVLDPASVRSDGEMDVIAWISGLGVRLPSFKHLLDFLADLLDTVDAGADSTQVRSVSELADYLAA